MHNNHTDEHKMEHGSTTLISYVNFLQLSHFDVFVLTPFSLFLENTPILVER